VTADQLPNQMGSEEPQAAPPAPAGLPHGSAVLRLQEVDLAVDRLHARLAQLETGDELRVARQRMADAEGRFSEARFSVEDVAREQRRIEGDVDSIQQKIDAERKRMVDGSVANARELQSMAAEVESLTHRKSRMEDGLLDLMERREELESKLPPLEAELAEARERQALIEETSGKDLVEVERALKERTAERERAAAAVDPDLLELYEDLRRQKKGLGAAALVDGVCQACHQKLSPVYVDRLKRSGDVWRCEYCRRILVPD
jgi:uncharacterized protein